MLTVRELADKMYDAFVLDTRNDGSSYWVLDKAKQEPWMDRIVRACHNHCEILPDDYRYQFIVDGLSALTDHEDISEARESLEADIYTSELCKWLASHAMRTCYCDDANEEYGGDVKGIVDLMQLGQVYEKHEVFDVLIQELERLADESDSEDGDDD